MTQLLLGPCSNKRENRLENRGGKRQSQAVNDSTDSAKDLVSSSTHLLPASQAYCTSVVNMHSNIPSRDFTTRNKTKEESKQDVRTTQLTKFSASNSSRVKAVSDKALTIVPPIIMVIVPPSDSLEACAMARLQPDGADEALCADSEKAMLCNSNMSPQGPSHAEDLKVNASAQPALVTESHARRSESKSPLEEALTKHTMKTVCNRPIAQSCDLQLSKSPGSVTQHQDDGWDQVGRGPEVGMRNDLLSPKETGLMTGNSVHSVQVEPVVSRDDSLVQTNLLWPRSFPGDPDKDAHVARTIGCATAPTKAADKGEAASAQVVKRGPQV